MVRWCQSMADRAASVMRCDPALTHRLVQQHSFAIFNRVLGSGSPSGFKSLPLVPLGLEREAHLLPQLLSLNDTETTTTAKAELVDKFAITNTHDTSSRPFCKPSAFLLLASAETPARLQAHLTRHLVAHLPGLGKSLLRWYDPLVFIHLLGDLHSDLLRSLFGPIERITFTLHGAWYTADAPTVAVGSAHWTFAATETALLSDIALVNAVLTAIEWREFESLPTRTRAIRSAIERARNHHGLSTPEDLIAFATHTLLIHPRFDEHPHLKSLLIGLRTPAVEDEQDRQSYADATALLTDAVWRQLRDDLNTARSSAA